MNAELRGLLDRQEAAGCPLARELRVLRQMCSCLNDDHSVDEAEQRYAEMVSQLSVAQGQGFVMVPVKYATDAQKKIGWTLDIDWVCGLEPKDAEYWPGLEEAEAVILALIPAAPAQPDGVK